MRLSRGDGFFKIINTTFLVLIGATMIAPMLHVAALSLSSKYHIIRYSVTFWPKGWNLDAYRYVFARESLWRSLGVSIIITVGGTMITLSLVSMLSYSLSRPHMPQKKLILKAILVTFIFPVPLIPYYLVVRGIGIENTLWALMLPNAVSAFYVFIMKTFFQGISSELFDASTIDGCSEYRTYFQIVLPLSTAVLATIGLFFAVGQWNMYFQALIFIRDKDLRPIQLLLRSLIIEEESSATVSAIGSESDFLENYTPEQMKAAIIMFATIPILVVYPFLQKYFVKGAMLGSLKG